MLINIATFTPMYISLMWAFILMVSSKHNRARFGLGIFMFITSLLFLSHVVYYNKLKDTYIYFDLVFIFSSLSVFPLYYWYIKLLTVESRFDFKDIKLIIPSVVLLFSTSIIYLLMPAELREMYVNNYLFGDGNMDDAPLLIKVQKILCYLLQFIYFVQIIYFTLKMRFYIKKYNEKVANFYSNLENQTIEWPKMILYSFIAMAVVCLIANFMGRSYFSQSAVILLVTGVSFGILLFLFGYLGYMQNHSIVALEEPDTFLIMHHDVENPNHKKIKAQLVKLFEKEQIYKNSELKITDLAARLNTNRTYLSSMINNDYSCSFSIFVNQYRIEEAKKALLDNLYNNYTLEHISTLVGFGSLHSFIRVFKEMEGITPGYFRDTAKKEQLQTPEKV